MARKILLADDSVTAQNMGRRILTDAGYEVITVNNGSAALKKIAEIVPDLIVLDVYMPGYGGLEVCQRLKESSATARIPVLLTVGKLEPFKADEAKRVRADAHIIKPFDTNELLAAIIKLEDRIVPQPAVPKAPRSGKLDMVDTPTPRKGRQKSEDAGTETGTGWKKRLSIPRKPAVIAPAKPDAAIASAPPPAFRDLNGREQSQPETPAATPPGQQNFISPLDPSPEIPAPAVSLEKFGAELASKLAGLNLAETPAAPGEPPAEPSFVADIPKEAAATIAPTGGDLKVEPEINSRSIAAESSDSQSPNESEIMAALASLSGLKIDDPPFASENVKNLPDAPPADAVAQLQIPPLEAKVAPPTGPRWLAEPVTLSDGDAHLILEAEMEKAYAAFAATQGATMVAGTTQLENAESPTTESEIELKADEIKTDEIKTDEITTDEITTDEMKTVSVAAENDAMTVTTPTPVPVSIPEVFPFETFREIPQHFVEVAETPAGRFGSDPVVSSEAIAFLESSNQDFQNEQPSAIAEAGSAPHSDATGEAEAPSFIDRISQTVAASSAADMESINPPDELSAETDSTRYHEIAYAAAASAGSVAAEKNIEIFSRVVDTPPDADMHSRANLESTETIPEPVPESVAEAMPPVPESFSTTVVSPERESELAAAWQNWKQIRESIAGPQLTSQIADAAAAGFKQIRREEPYEPESAIAASNRAAEEASAIANIVDSVLAELKPKLMEEITRKLAKDRK